MLAALLLFIGPVLQTGDLPNQYEILEHLKVNVKEQLALAANYTCVETIERTYYQERHACVDGGHSKREEFMRDRLRLDVAVSQGTEIFSWHGEDRFTSSDISKIIHNGPQTSGQFVGFLRNIFQTPGVQFNFNGSSQLNGRTVYNFGYVVQLLRSNYFVKGREEGTVLPYHGDFSVDAETFDLVRLDIIADQVPLSSGICGAETDIEYQLVNISGRQDLLPASFELKMRANNDLYTVTHTDYQQCREFRGESTLHFTAIDPGTAVAKKRVIDEPLPAGMTFRAKLNTDIDDRTAYMGDAVEATLDETLRLPGTNTIIPKGATLHGVISKVEQHSELMPYWLFSIKFERMNAGEDSYILNASPLLASDTAALNPRFQGRRILSSASADAAKQGFWLMYGQHFRLPKHVTLYWRTERLNAPNS